MRSGGAVTSLPARSTALLRLSGLCPYYTMFPLSFAFGRLASAGGSDWLIDPFCGRGTSNFAARLRGIPSVGVDSNPVAAATVAAKLVDTTPGRIVAAARTILDDGRRLTEVPDGEFWKLACTIFSLIRWRSLPDSLK